MFYKEVNFKETSIGRIPEDWEVIRIQEVADIRSNRSKLEATDKVAFIPMELIPNDGIYADFEIRDFHRVSSYTYCEAGDILLAKITPSLENGKQGIVPSNTPKGFALATTEVFPIVCRNVERMFMFYLLKYPKFRKILESSMRATTGRLRVPKDALLHLRIPIPKFDEQQKIAKILSTVDEAIQKTNEIIAKTERLKKDLMQELLTKGIGHKEFKDTEIGRIPKDWESAKITNIFDLYKGKTPSTKIKEYWDGNIPFVTPTDITKINDANGIYLETTEKYITEKGLKSNGLKLVPKGSILFTSRATIGYLAINKTEVAINQGIISLIPKRANVDVTFFCYLFQKLKNLFENLAGGSTYKEISMSTFSNVNIAIPPFSEQQKIAEILFAVDRKLEIERNEKAKLERIRQGLIDLLLTGKIRIRVGEIS
jgi:type I restriction enzyme S subunit